MIKTLENKDGYSIDYKKIFKGVIISVLSTLVLLIIFSVLLTYTNIQEKTIPVVTIIIVTISLLLGGTISTTNIKKNGMITGATVGLIYILSIYIISSIIIKNFSLNTYSIVILISSIFAGAVGGIIGVNIK